MDLEKFTKFDRVNQDIHLRSMPGIVAYSILWPILVLVSGFGFEFPKFSLVLTAAFLSISALRLLFYFQAPKYLDFGSLTYRYLFILGPISHSLLWGGVFAVVVSSPEYHSILVATIVVSCGLSSGAVASFSPSKTLFTLYHTTLLLPGLTAALMAEEQRSMGALMVVYLIFMLSISYRTHTEYLKYFAIEKSLHEKQAELERISKTDGLTGLVNRGEFDKQIQHAWSRAIRVPTDFCLLMIDIDHFKLINDTYGHLAGDQCLRQVAQLLKDQMKRDTDVVARYGGEEFVILMEATPLVNTMNIADLIKANIEAMEIPFEGKVIKLTVSIGVSTIRPKQETKFEELIKQADQALYHAKWLGRNRVAQFSDEIHS